MAVQHVSPKTVTFTFGTLDASAQVVMVEPGRTATNETLQTLGDELTTTSAREVSVGLSLVFDPNAAGISDLLHAAWVSGVAGTLVIDYGGAVSTVSAVKVTALSEVVDAAAGQVMQSATIVTTEADLFVWLTAP